MLLAKVELLDVTLSSVDDEDEELSSVAAASVFTLQHSTFSPRMCVLRADSWNDASSSLAPKNVIPLASLRCSRSVDVLT